MAGQRQRSNSVQSPKANRDDGLEAIRSIMEAGDDYRAIGKSTYEHIRHNEWDIRILLSLSLDQLEKEVGLAPSQVECIQKALGKVREMTQSEAKEEQSLPSVPRRGRRKEESGKEKRKRGTVVTKAPTRRTRWKGTVADDEGRRYEVYSEPTWEGTHLVMGETVTFMGKRKIWDDNTKEPISLEATEIEGPGIRPNLIEL